MPNSFVFSGKANCPGNPLLTATVTATQLTAYSVLLTIKNHSNSQGAIGHYCLEINNLGTLTVTGTGTIANTCPHSCRDLNPNYSRLFTEKLQKIDPGHTDTWTITSTQPLTESDFTKVALFFQDIQGCPTNRNSECLTSYPSTTINSTTTATTSTNTNKMKTASCPIANPQSCSHQVIEFDKQIVPPIYGDVDTDVFFSQSPVIEDVCPEKVIVCGKLTKVIKYNFAYNKGTLVKNVITDERAFQCVIDREDANEGDHFEVVGFDVLCEGAPKLFNKGSRPDPKNHYKSVDVFSRLVEKDIIKICIRKVENGNYSK